MTNFLVLASAAGREQPIQRLQLVARSTADALSAAKELVPEAARLYVALQGEW